MRMIKRIAVGVLTAAMALSLLTACGGGEAPAPSENPGNNNSNSSSNENKPEEKPEEKPNKPEEKPDDSLNGLADGTEIAFQNSRSYKLLQQVKNSKRLYMKAEMTAQGQKVVSESAQQTTDGVTKVYSKSTSQGQTSESLLITDGKNSAGYQLFSKQKMAWLQNMETTNSGSSNTNPNNITYTVKKTTRVVDAVPYYAEEVTMTDPQSKRTETMILCYDNTNTLVYVVYEPGTPNEQLVHVLAFSSAIPSSVILNVPNDWEVYTFVYDKDNRLEKITAPDGHELTNEERSQLYERAYS